MIGERTFNSEIDRLIDMGFSLIPTREDKKPFSDWAANPKMSPIELADALFKHKSNSVAVRLGSQSESLVCLDLDEKHYIGFSARFLKELNSLTTVAFRTESTPSGGYHLFYRVDGEIGGTKNVAYREATEEELKIAPKVKKIGFLEVRGEGGLCQTYPSVGYNIINDIVPPIISQEEHQKIFSFCCSFNEVIPQEREIKVSKKDDDIYDENPFEHFDKSGRGEKVLEEEGWIYRYSAGGKDLYSKPGSKDKDIHAWFNHAKRFYVIYTTNAGIDAKGYSPCNLLASIRFNGDKKATFAHLIASGFGKIKPGIEKNIIKRKVLDGGELPANISEEGKKQWEEGVKMRKEMYPYGVFWTEDDNGNCKIERESLYVVAGELGFRKYQESPVRIESGYISRVTDTEFFDILKEYIKVKDVSILSCYEDYLQKSGKYTIFRLKELDKNQLFRSSKKTSYKFFNNCYVEITKEFVECHSYENIGKLIWKDKIQNRDFTLLMEDGLAKYEGKLYYDFLKKAIGIDSYLMKCIGYLSHDYKDQEGYFPVATESCEDIRKGGGSGKNVFCSMFKSTVTYISTAASQVKTDSTLLQSLNGESVFCLSDMPKGFKLMPFKDLVTDGAVVKKLYINEYHIPVDEMPKLLGSTNYSLDDTDPGLHRRIREIEFTEFFTKAGGVREHYGKMFPNDFNEDDYLYFDNFIIECIQVYLHFNGVIEKKPLSSGGWAKKFDGKYKHIREFISQNIENWVKTGQVSNEQFRSDYEVYCKENEIKTGYQAYTTNLALDEYCSHYKINFNKAGSWREGIKVIRGRVFGDEKPDEQPQDLPF